MSGEIRSRGPWSYRAGCNDKVRKVVGMEYWSRRCVSVSTVQLGRGGLADDHDNGIITVVPAS